VEKKVGLVFVAMTMEEEVVELVAKRLTHLRRGETGLRTGGGDVEGDEEDEEGLVVFP
jgi:hypothetical protein